MVFLKAAKSFQRTADRNPHVTRSLKSFVSCFFIEKKKINRQKVSRSFYKKLSPQRNRLYNLNSNYLSPLLSSAALKTMADFSHYPQARWEFLENLRCLENVWKAVLKLAACPFDKYGNFYENTLLSIVFFATKLTELFVAGRRLLKILPISIFISSLGFSFLSRERSNECQLLAELLRNFFLLERSCFL